MMTRENLLDVEDGSEVEGDVLTKLSESYLDKNFMSKWKPAKIQLFLTKSHKVEFEEKKQEMLIRGRKGAEMDERFGFVVENNISGVELMSTLGLQVHDSEYNALGYNRMGVYICKHGDVTLQHALVKYSGFPVIRLVICKYIVGRHTTAIPRVASAAEFIEPTQGFDCHTSVIPPNSKDSLQNQFDRSQVYIYEINKLLQPCVRPRQVLPYAVIHFTEDGIYTPLIDAEATSAEKLSDNPRLQQIVNAINNKENGELSPGSSTDMAAPIPVIGAGVINRSTSLSPNMLHGSGGMVGKLGLPMHNGPLIMSPTSPAMIPTLENTHWANNSNNPLKRAISQLTAKLEAEERTKKAAGTDVISGQLKTVTRQPVAQGLPIRMSGVPTTPTLGRGLHSPVASIPGLQSGTPNGSLQLNQASINAYLSNVHSMQAVNPAVNFLGGAGQHNQALLAANASPFSQGGLLQANQLPAGFTFQSAAALQKAASASQMHGAGILGSIPPSALHRSSPLMSMPGGRSITPDMQSTLQHGGMQNHLQHGGLQSPLQHGGLQNPLQHGLLQANGAGGIFNPATGLVMSSSPLSFTQTQLAPAYSMAGMYSTGLVPSYAGAPLGYGGLQAYTSIEQQLALQKEAVKIDYPAAMTLLGAKDPKMQGLYYPAMQPTAAAPYGQTMLLNQSLKRPLEGVAMAHAIDKRMKYF